MNKNAMIALMGFAAAGVASAANVTVSSDITNSVTWTSDNVYELVGQRYVRGGATLTIQPGTLIQSDTTGSLAIERGSKIYANGTKDAPVIFTSVSDNLTDWHEGCQEWGNLTVMGNALIANSFRSGNTATPTGLNVSEMEGLVEDSEIPGNEILYGGDDDDDNSGALTYVSLRYGGKNVALNKELNGLSMGGIGRETDVHHIDIMNNVDDGIETWGGTVNYKYINIWNIGDDSMDIDQGWRGHAQFGLIVQGYSQDASQGSGVGDNAIEHDGAEDSDAQPVTTGRIANFTVIGQPGYEFGATVEGGDGLTAWRDGCRMQYANCIFMDGGEKVVRPDGDDGDGSSGYGYNGTLTFAEVWTTSATNYSAVNIGSADPTVLYTAQDPDGMLAEIKDSVFYNNGNADAYTEADARGVFDAANNNVKEPAGMPIQGLSRDAGVLKGGKWMQAVTNINPCAANDAVTAVNSVKADSFIKSVSYRGAFSPNYNWLAGWTSVDAYGMTDTSMNTNAPAATIDTGVVVSFQSEFGVEYTIERADSASGPWNVAMTVVGDGSYMTFGDSDLQSAEFYRVVLN